MRIVWWVLRYLFIIVALVVLGFGLADMMREIAWSELTVLIAMGYAVVAPLKALWGWWRNRVVVNDAAIE